ncbi:unnamed protein product [Pleuronectes platessa]|uniref:Uncharacterized protein n=1 Tax=Pleuronectes platessa TaxID=8262 RepID=A0A9N7VH53_PLEPL|nr:unnamed protein product [Pleuronectes platessa]
MCHSSRRGISYGHKPSGHRGSSTPTSLSPPSHFHERSPLSAAPQRSPGIDEVTQGGMAGEATHKAAITVICCRAEEADARALRLDQISRERDPLATTTQTLDRASPWKKSHQSTSGLLSHLRTVSEPGLPAGGRPLLLPAIKHFIITEAGEMQEHSGVECAVEKRREWGLSGQLRAHFQALLCSCEHYHRTADGDKGLMRHKNGGGQTPSASASRTPPPTSSSSSHLHPQSLRQPLPCGPQNCSHRVAMVIANREEDHVDGAVLSVSQLVQLPAHQPVQQVCSRPFRSNT